jgi:ubiquinone/menaquinone biosynthesis C-methylase UbiE
VVEKLPFADGSFDAVLSSLMMHHLPDDIKQKRLAEIWRVLKQGESWMF